MNHATSSIKSTGCQKTGSVIVIAVLTLAILSLIAAGTLAVISSKYNSTFQASSWQESLQGAEAGVDIAMDALNRNSWSGWNQVTSSTPPRSAPSGSPSPAPSASPPANGQCYFYQPPALTHVGEGNNTIKMFITVDTGGMSPGTSGQWYRIRATGTTDISGTPRASSEKLDNNLRKLSLFTDRITGLSLFGPGQPNKGHAQRTIEVIAEPPNPVVAGSTYGLVSAGAIKLPGLAVADSFNSLDPTKSTNGVYDPAKAQHNASISTLASTGSNLNEALVWGNVTYSGPTLKGTTPEYQNGTLIAGVSGTVATPYYTTIPSISDPTGTFDTTTVPANPTGPITLAAGPVGSPKQYKVNGGFTLNSGNASLIAQKTNNGTNNNYIIIWVTGTINITPQATIIIQDGVNVKIYGDSDINFDGGTFNNQNTVATSGKSPASMLTIYGTAPAQSYDSNGNPVGTTGKMNISGTGGSFVGIIDAPGYYVNAKSSFTFIGAVTAGSCIFSSASALHFDEALLGGGGNGGNNSSSLYAYASWFEDTR